MNIFHGWRLESDKAVPQSLQVWNTTHALAPLCDRVFLCVDHKSDFLSKHPPGLRRPKILVLGDNHAGAAMKHRVQVSRFLLGSEAGIYYDRHIKHMSEFLSYPKNSNKRRIFEWHELPSLSRQWRGETVPDKLREIESYLWAKCDAHVVISEGLAKHLESKLGPTKKPVQVIANAGPDLRNLWRKGLRQEDGPFIAVLASLFRKPGEYEWLKAFSTSIPENWRLHIYGPPGPHDLEGERLRSFGWCPPAQIHRALCRADLIICPFLDAMDRKEIDSPLKLWDAIASARPILTADLDVARQITKDGAHYLPPSPAEKWGDYMQTLGESPMVLERSAMAMKEVALDNTWTRRARRLMRFFAQVQKSEMA